MNEDNYPYNDDLLIAPEDQTRARQDYGPVANALIFPELIAEVKSADAISNAAKRVVRNWGLASIVMVTAALLAASGAPLYEGTPSARPIVILSALLGVLGCIGGFGIFSSRAKARWLENRLVTESLRQFHFRLLMSSADEIVKAADASEADDQAFARYRARRKAALASHAQNLIRRKAEELEALIDPNSRRQMPDIDPMPSPGDFAGGNGRLLLDAFHELRLLRQRQYADHKLKNDRRIFSKFPKAQASVIGIASLGCVLLLLVLHLLSAGQPLFEQHAPGDGESHGWLQWAHQLAIWTAIVALGLRALEEGLKPRTEIERYQHYQITTDRLLDRFEEGDISRKILKMRGLETAAHDEMVNFLRSNSEARFVM